ncbi:MAG TPA: DNA polymerase III subunit epsilon [Salinisphaeraceae bacterium]|nr:DNA polymerase III subunit epsilon [Salinisphaeraceae bacterium]
MRQIVLDTETTGLEPGRDHRILEIGCVEILNRRITRNNLHLYINPEREVDPGAAEVHGLTLDQLLDKPKFHEIADELRAYLDDAELIIHNAPFDLGFLNAEFARLDDDATALEERHSIIDTLIDARKRYPGQRNSLDALCKRFEIDNSARELHGALLDAELLADVYLAMTGGQIDIGLGSEAHAADGLQTAVSVAQKIQAAGKRPRICQADAAELAEHERYLQMLAESSHNNCLWLELEPQAAAQAQ